VARETDGGDNIVGVSGLDNRAWEAIDHAIPDATGFVVASIRRMQKLDSIRIHAYEFIAKID
jgi:hypothetical protein